MLGVVRLYGETAVLAIRRGARAWPVVFSLVLYAGIFMVVGQLVSALGPAGGFILGLVFAACFSSYIHLISQVVAGSKVSFTDLRQSFGARFWDVVSVLFAFWIIDLVLSMIAGGPKGPIILALVGLAMAVFFNPVPELLYQGTTRSFQLLFESARFISRSGLEWLLPNVLFAAALLAPLGMLHGPVGLVVLNISSLLSLNNNGMGLFGLFSRAPLYLQIPMLLFIHFVMVFRGLLFGELMRGGSRQRDMREVWKR